MIRTTLEEFQQSLRETGAYRTADDHRAPVRARPGALTTLRFSLGVVKVFPMSAVLEPIGRLNQKSWAQACFATVETAERLGMSVAVEGFAVRASVPGPVVYLCNHMSTVETILLPPILLAHGSFSFVAKESLSRLPFLHKAAAHMRMVPIGRKSPREDLLSILSTGVERLRGGDDFLIFPQGTRDSVFRRRRYSSIGAKLAERAGCPIVPVVVDTRCQPRRDRGLLRKVFADFGPVDVTKDVRVAFGPVIAPGKAKDMHEAAFDWMAGRLESWGLPTERD